MTHGVPLCPFRGGCIEKEEGIVKKLLNFMNELVSEDVLVEEDTELIMSGLLDSANIVSLLTYIENVTGRQMDVSDVELDLIATPRAIQENYIDRGD